MHLPQLSEYIVALAAAIEEATDAQRAMLEAHIAAPNHQLTATQLAQAAGYSSYGVANIQYGAFAHKVCDQLKFNPPTGNSGRMRPAKSS